MPALDMDRQRAFWDFKAAAGYPEPDGDPELWPEILTELRAAGLPLARADILDVGCGTGRYTLPLAKATAGRVVGVDLSPAMIARMQNSAHKLGLDNIEPVCAAWESIDAESRGWRRGFDLAFAAMTPALNSPDGLAAFRACSRGWCAVIGWGRYRKNALWEEIYAALGIPLTAPPGLPGLRERLAEQGVATEAQWRDDGWTWVGSLANALEEVLWSLRLAGHLAPDDRDAEPIRNQVWQILAAHARDGEVRHETRMEKGWIVWREAAG